MTSAADFERTGLSVRMRTGTRITRFQVVGERASGTNFVTRLLGRNSDLRPSRALGWKHGFPHVVAIPPDLAVIGVVRRADAWALSMHARPWHCSEDMQRLEFSDFIRAEWETRVDRPRYFDGMADRTLVGQPLQLDRHPLTGQCLANIFALRMAKLDALLSYDARACTFILLRLEELVEHPEIGLDRLLSALGQPAREGPFRPVVRRLGQKFAAAVPDRPETPQRMTDEDRAFLRQNVDLDREAALGYSY